MLKAVKDNLINYIKMHVSLYNFFVVLLINCAQSTNFGRTHNVNESKKINNIVLNKQTPTILPLREMINYFQQLNLKIDSVNYNRKTAINSYNRKDNTNSNKSKLPFEYSALYNMIFVFN